MIIPSSIEELAGFVEQDGKRSFFLWRTGVAIVVISILPCQRLRRAIQSSPLFEWTETSIWIWPNSGMYMESLALLC